VSEKESTGILRSRQNPRVQEARRLARDPHLARHEGLFVADGTTLVREALEADLPAKAIFLDPADPEAEAIRTEATLRKIRPILAASTVLRAISNLATPQGAVGIFARPHHDLSHLLAATRAEGHPLIAVFHELQDPTNVGALIRTALAAGLAGVVSTEQTCDPFHPRAVRAAMGACLRLPICVDQPAAPLWQAMKRGGYRLLALDPRGDVPLAGLRLDRPTALLLGREGSGLEREARRACDASVRIPMAPGVESLGVAAAGAIVFYCLAMTSAQ
jgi:RNA methyltransferase, TrmH family